MNAARIAVLVVAIGAAGGAAFVAKTMLPGGAPAPVVQAPVIKVERVLVAARDVPLGTTIKADDLRWQDWPQDAISERYVTIKTTPSATQDYTGAVARAPLMNGEPVTESKLVRAGKGSFMSAILSSGMRAASTKISPETGAGGFILPNDRVDVILTRKEKTDGNEGDGEFVSETILRNVRVLAIDQTVKEDDGRQVVVGKTATFELTPAQAEVLELGNQLGDLSLALRSLADAQAQGDEIQYEQQKKADIRVLKYGVASTVTSTR